MASTYLLAEAAAEFSAAPKETPVDASTRRRQNDAVQPALAACPRYGQGPQSPSSISRWHPARIEQPERDENGVGTLRLPRFRQDHLWRFAMKTMTVAGALLALALAGCAMPGSGGSGGSGSRSSMSHSDSYAKADPANYHAADFGEPDNQPFDGAYSGNW
jgi:hypothetical protein